MVEIVNVIGKWDFSEFSLENIPRRRSAGCLSLRFGSLMTALVVIVSTVIMNIKIYANFCEVKNHYHDDDSGFRTNFYRVLDMAIFLSPIFFYSV